MYRTPHRPPTSQLLRLQALIRAVRVQPLEACIRKLCLCSDGEVAERYREKNRADCIVRLSGILPTLRLYSECKRSYSSNCGQRLVLAGQVCLSLVTRDKHRCIRLLLFFLLYVCGRRCRRARQTSYLALLVRNNGSTTNRNRSLRHSMWCQPSTFSSPF